MTSTAREIPNCSACGLPGVARDPFFYDWKGRRFDIYRCRTCTHQFVYPPVSPEEQAEIYSDRYFGEGGDWAVNHFGGQAYTDSEPHLRREAKLILAKLLAAPRGLLDIGCAGGVFLDEARRAGYHDLAGIEINPTMAHHACLVYGLDVFTGGIEEAEIPCQFGAITLMDVLEHIPDPLAAMRKVVKWLKPNGHVLIHGPLSNSRIGRAKETARRILRRDKQLPGYPLDANMFNPRSLVAMMRAAGLEAVRWSELGPASGTLLAWRTGERKNW